MAKTKFAWTMNDRGLWAWFDGTKQISGAYRDEDEKEYAYDAHRLKLLEDNLEPEVKDYNTWYSPYSKHLAITYTKEYLSSMLKNIEDELKLATDSHLRAIEKSRSMQSNSWNRAQSGSVVRHLSSEKLSILSALEIFDTFPQYAKK